MKIAEWFAKNAGLRGLQFSVSEADRFFSSKSFRNLQDS